MGAGIVLYECLAPDQELLSEGFDRYLEGRYRIPAAVVPFLVAGHVTNAIPLPFDVIAQGFRFMRWLRSKR